MGVSVIGVPYHLDEYLPGLDLTPRPDQTITVPLTQGTSGTGQLADLRLQAFQALQGQLGGRRGARPTASDGAAC